MTQPDAAIIEEFAREMKAFDAFPRSLRDFINNSPMGLDSISIELILQALPVIGEEAMLKMLRQLMEKE